jgi:hypothetical protein
MEQYAKVVDGAKTKINDNVGKHFLSDFLVGANTPNTFVSYCNITNSVCINIRDIDEGCTAYLIKESIEMNNRMIAHIDEANQKLEELKKELKDG